MHHIQGLHEPFKCEISIIYIKRVMNKPIFTNYQQNCDNSKTEWARTEISLWDLILVMVSIELNFQICTYNLCFPTTLLVFIPMENYILSDTYDFSIWHRWLLFIFRQIRYGCCVIACIAIHHTCTISHISILSKRGCFCLG